MKPTDGGAELHNVGVAHEHSDVNVRAVIMFAIGLVVVAAIVHVAMWLLFGAFERSAVRNDPIVSPVAAPQLVMPKSTAGSPYFGGAAGPQLVTDEPRLLQMLRARENQDLHSYGWIDQRGGVARIPIEQAEKLLLQRGLPARSSDQAAPQLGAHGQSLGESSSGRAIPIVQQRTDGERPAGGQPGPGTAQPGPGGAQPPAGSTPAKSPGGGA